MMEIFEKATIVNVISTSAQQAKDTNSAYGSAKAGLAHFFRSLQQEFSSERYRISNLFPGMIRTHGEEATISAIEPGDLSQFIYQLVDNSSSVYLSEVTLLPR